MKLGIIISTNDAETCWNALRYANYGLKQKYIVQVFLIGKGVEYLKVSSDEFNTQEEAEKFQNGGGTIFACGTCVKARGDKDSKLCPISSLKDLDDVIMKSDKIVTF
ncbi:MAG: sulfur reduction protein DsrE [Candidatus Aenigmarchaeota archaeon CG_4_10_14_0_8_um_filter_37_24]|nr:sulfur reduction protein DsrE [Candidatus Aenigmarchaeota archaeon]OIN88666.1 MAG: sulfur reduction protein DsrE [Candidatus Aenigmarchaeota archaeon CG1_02_38_14]PIV68072.1 MAG: sulfur reduction protein DsrE [Candidatus Aenigmarchaeota archaeon CG01_land_8_20_14_3_00_37_9]PIW40777.1 MAG: sulfur reduction protein DsrE [Candidatus Aenigmarchaeota archaeon CG15_BIG_FIL_POST_REV_8_21_14_020_37_27]PIX50605.1 MAG: sulfur reduction protein DsrE [Candidatus Aenigmarchaeota archaeon CG_4_8_14_3_um_f